MIKLNCDNVFELYRKMNTATGGGCGIRDMGMLEAAVEAPFQTFSGIELFPSLMEKAARLGFGLISNHPFLDGNKRIGILAMLVYLDINGICIEFTDLEIIRLGLGVADGSLGYTDLLTALRQKTI